MLYLWRFERIIRGEMNSDQKHTPCIRTIWGTHYGSLPMKHVFTNRSCSTNNIESVIYILWWEREHKEQFHVCGLPYREKPGTDDGHMSIAHFFLRIFLELREILGNELIYIKICKNLRIWIDLAYYNSKDEPPSFTLIKVAKFSLGSHLGTD